MQAGQTVVYVDVDGVSHDAKIVTVHGEKPGPRELDITYQEAGADQGDGDTGDVLAEHVPHITAAPKEVERVIDQPSIETPVPPYWQQK